MVPFSGPNLVPKNGSQFLKCFSRFRALFFASRGALFIAEMARVDVLEHCPQARTPLVPPPCHSLPRTCLTHRKHALNQFGATKGHPKKCMRLVIGRNRPLRCLVLFSICTILPACTLHGEATQQCLRDGEHPLWSPPSGVGLEARRLSIVLTTARLLHRIGGASAVAYCWLKLSNNGGSSGPPISCDSSASAFSSDSFCW